MATLIGSIDRIDENIAVIILNDDEHELQLPADLLPSDAEEGQAYTITIERNQEEEQKLAAEIEALRADLGTGQ